MEIKPTPIRHNDDLIIYLAASGHKTKEIAERLDMDPSNVSRVLNQERSQFELRKLRHQLYGKDIKKRFQDLLPAAVAVVEETLTRQDARPQLKFAAAQEVFDRSLGKPKQTVEVEGSMIKAVFEQLDNKNKPPIDVTPGEEPKEFEGEAVPAYVPNPNETVPRDAIDKYVEENL